ncbi:MAG TPA: alpha-glucan family phosphorylase [Sedimenticola sp.]|nr:alpha-glucan family phosphorylase [Sedimenticola sp.]
MTLSPCFLLPKMPPGLEPLADLALNMRWSWNHASDALWEQLDPGLWEQTRNPWLILQSISEQRLRELATDRDFTDRVGQLTRQQRESLEKPGWFQQLGAGRQLTGIAYFSMEFGLTEVLPLYSGGLGILAGDCLKTASDLDVPLVGISLLYQQGYFRQVLDSHGRQLAFYPYNDPIQMPVMPVRDAAGEWLHLSIGLPGRTLRLQVWQAVVGRVKLYLLDSNDPLNSPADRSITGELYGGGSEMRLQQELVLGIGGWRLVQALGLDPEVCHLNEGHAAFAILERARDFMAREQCDFETALTATRAGNLFTTHTPVAAGFDLFTRELMALYFSGYCRELGIDLERLLNLGRAPGAGDHVLFNAAWLAIRGSGAVNGVSELHGSVSRALFQPLFPRWPRSEVPVGHITNGVHMPSWDSAESDRFWTCACGQQRWLGTLETTAERIRELPDETFWSLRSNGRQQLIAYARRRLQRQWAESGTTGPDASGGVLDPNALTLCFSRRFTSYKRPNLLLTDPERLVRLLTAPGRPVQLVIAGKAHPRDEQGKAMIQEWIEFIGRNRLHNRVVFINDYDIRVAEQLVQGADLWINTPRRPWEASGTSGMKVLPNGGLNLSELDGWWAEAYEPGVGWAIGDRLEHGADPEWDRTEAETLYRILEQEVIPCFYRRDDHGIPREWVALIRASMARLTPRFSSNRMLREYVEQYYLELAAGYRQRAAEGGKAALELNRWRTTLEQHWPMVHFGDLAVDGDNGRHRFSVALYLDDLPAESVAVELFADNGEAPPEIHAMERGEPLTGAVNGFLYHCEIAGDRPPEDYTPRARPAHPLAQVPLEATGIVWQR